jgi:hypothetical protein
MKKIIVISLVLFVVFKLNAQSDWTPDTKAGKIIITEGTPLPTDYDIDISRNNSNSGLKIFNALATGRSSVMTGEAGGGKYVYLGYNNTNHAASGAFKPASAILYTGAPNGMKLMSDYSLSIITGGSEDLHERVRILSNGNIGIGTINPDKLLTLNGELGFFRNGTNPTNVTVGFIKYDAGFIFGNSSIADPLRFQTNSVDRLFIQNDGNIGIGTSAPEAKLSLRTTESTQGLIVSNCDIVGHQSHLGFTTADRSKIGLSTESYFNLYNDGKWNFNSANTNGSTLPISFSTDGMSRLHIKADGNVGIGTANPDAKLTVNGNIHAKEVKVDLSVPGPDYVFEETYKLRSLTEIENYIKENKHLPEVPSAKEMEQNGVNISEMNMLLLKKVEELTLHLIELKKSNDLQQREIEKLKANKK